MPLAIRHLLIGFLSIFNCNGAEDWLHNYDALFKWESPAAADMNELMSSFPPPITGSQNDPKHIDSFGGPQTGLHFPPPITGSQNDPNHTDSFGGPQTGLQSLPPITGSPNDPYHIDSFGGPQTGLQFPSPITSSQTGLQNDHNLYSFDSYYHPDPHMNIPFFTSESHGGFANPPAFNPPANQDETLPGINSMDPILSYEPIAALASLPDQLPHLPFAFGIKSPELNQQIYSANPGQKYADPILNAWDHFELKPPFTKRKSRAFQPRTRPHHRDKRLKVCRPSEGPSAELLDSHGSTSKSSRLGMDTPSPYIIKNLRKKIEGWYFQIVNEPDNIQGPMIYWRSPAYAKKHHAQFPQHMLNIKAYSNSRTSVIREGCELRRMKFDKNTFTNHEWSQEKFYSNIMNLIEQLPHQEALQGKLVMTPNQFIGHHTLVNWIYPIEKVRSGASKRQPRPDGQSYNSNDNKEGRRRMTTAHGYLLENKQAWYAHWKEILNWKDPGNPIDLIEKIRPAKMRDTVITFLFFVEMIDSIVPRSRPQGSSSSALEEGFLTLERLFNPEKKIDQSVKDERRDYILKKLVIRPRTSDVLPALWALLEAWLETYRKSFFDKIIKSKRNLDTTKSFFNTVFFYSIHKLNTQIQES